MASDVDICNVALARLGVGLIQSLSEASRPARLCAVLYPKCAKELLRIHAWHFAVKTKDLAQHSVAAPPSWAYRYEYPADCMKALKVITPGTPRDSDGELYTVEVLPDGSAKSLLTDASPASLQYVYENMNSVLYDEVFASALSYRLAIDLCVLLTDGANAAEERMERRFVLALGRARATDLNESFDVEQPEPGQITARGV